MSISAKIDEFSATFGGKPFSVLLTPNCKSKWKSIQNLVGQQVHAWKIVMVVIIEPLDLKVHVSKYMAGSVANNVIQIALRVDHDAYNCSGNYG